MLKLFLTFLFLLPLLADAQSGRQGTDVILNQVYGSIITECSRDTDADTTTANRLGPFTKGRRYIVYCHDGAGAGSACECLQGGSTVDNQAASTEGTVFFAGEKMIMNFQGTSLYISCVPYADNQQYDVCPLD